MRTLKRPRLEPTPLPNPFPEPRAKYITMSPGQWDAMLQGAYDADWTLLEVEDEKVVRAFKRTNEKADRSHPR